MQDSHFLVSGTNSIASHMWIQNAAYNLVERVREAEGEGSKKGLTYLCMSALVFVAFANEANLNLIGKLLPNVRWDERTTSTKEKLDTLTDYFQVDSKEYSDACSCAKGLIKIRNRFAHPKLQDPKEFKKYFATRPTETQIQSLQKPPFLKDCTVTEVERQYAAMEVIFETLVKEAGVNIDDYGSYGDLVVRETNDS